MARAWYYILDANGRAVQADCETWSAWFENNHERRRVAYDTVDDYEVSTVFLGLDHAFSGAPVLWETMIFKVGSRLDVRTWRYTSQDAAVKGHANAVRLVRRCIAKSKPLIRPGGRRRRDRLV